MRFLFRYRDLVADTLARHREVIQAQQSAWWGWWKRPSEDARRPIWKEMESIIASEGKVTVGLFDSGTGRVFRAEVVEVLPPTEVDHDVPVSPIPPSERDKIPEYYRESPFSRAWMRITELSEAPTQFFGEYSLREPPPLPQYAESVLRRLENKIIVEPDELRGMDTTIWAIRPKIVGDHDKPVILSTGAPAKAVDPHPIQLQSNTILHLTDLHFSVGRNRDHHAWKLEGEGGRTLADAIIAAVSAEKTKIGAVVISGDLTFVGSEAEFNHAIASIGKLMGPLNLAAEHVVVVPGNHDIQWTTDARYKEDAKVVNAPVDAKKNYEQFYRRLCRHPPNDTLSMGRRFVLPAGLTLDVAALNSSSLEQGKNFLAGMGKVETHALQDIANELQWSEDAPSLALRMLVLHHHLVLTENFEPANGYCKGFGIAVDAPLVQRLAARLGVHLAVHGHKHRAFLWKSGVFNLPEHSDTKHRLGDLAIVGGGSGGSTEVEAHSNYFNTITFSPRGLILSMFKSVRAEAFSVFQRWRSAFALSDGRLSLRDWELVDRTHWDLLTTKSWESLK